MRVLHDERIIVRVEVDDLLRRNVGDKIEGRSLQDVFAGAPLYQYVNRDERLPPCPNQGGGADPARVARLESDAILMVFITIPRGDTEVQSILGPVATLKVVPKVWSDDLRNVRDVGVIKSEREMFHISGMVQPL